MPQLDMLSWLNQVLTTTIVMFFFYALLSLIFLPNTSSIFKGRNKLQMFRQLNINFLLNQMFILIINITSDLNNFLTNHIILIIYYFIPTNSLQIKTELENMCYTYGFLDIGSLYTNFYIVNNMSSLLSLYTNSRSFDLELEENKWD